MISWLLIEIERMGATMTPGYFARLRSGLVLVLSLFVSSVTGWAAEGALSIQAVERANRDTVGIMSGSVGGTYVQFAQDLANTLDKPNKLRVIAMLGKGSIQNVLDLLYLRGVDLAIVQSDVLHFIREGNIVRGVDKIQYVTKLYNEEVHILARNDIRALEDLDGQRVSFGGKGSGTAMTASIVFDALDILVEPLHLAHSEGIKALTEGEIAAVVLVQGKPGFAIRQIESSAGLKLLGVEMVKGLDQIYLSGEFGHDDYPNLVPDGTRVNTVAVGAVMAVYAWKQGTNRYDRTAQFVQDMFGSLDKLRTMASHPKWRSVDLNAELPGWRRFPAAQELLEQSQ